MKYIFLVFVGVILLNKTKCLVTDRTRSIDMTTLPTADETVYLSENRFQSKSTKQEKSGVYLEDVVFTLKHQNWTAEELPCVNQTLLLLRSLQNFTLWAVWEWDAISSQPQGLLIGNLFELGNFDECMTHPWSENNEELKTQYCLADIVLERTDNAVRRRVSEQTQPYQSALDFMQYRPTHSRPLNELLWGACVPAVCPPRAVERLMALMLSRSYLSMAGIRPRIAVTEPCQKPNEPKQFDGYFYSFIAVMGTMTALVFICTYLHSKRKESEPENLKHEIIKAFSLTENAKDLLVMKKEGIEVLYGIRFLTICLIVMDHQVGMFNAGPISNGLEVDQALLSVFGLFILHDDLFVDTFFLLSGFLTATGFLRTRRFPNPLIFILKRYIRLVVAFAVVIFYITAIFPYSGSGPLWNRAVSYETMACRQNWWLSLLMLNNYVDNENICIVVSWYIPCDFHFFMVTVFGYWLYRRSPRAGVTCAGLLTVASVLVPGIINYINEMPAVQLFTYDFLKNPRASQQFHLTYIKSHARYAAYLVGFFSGYFFATCRAKGDIKKFSKKWSVLGACAGLIIMTVVMSTGGTYLWRTYHPLEGAVYAALNRPIWACGVAMLVLCCSLGTVPFVKRFLSWYPWAPLSRLSYGLYLTHTVFIMRNVSVSRNSQHNDYMQQLTQATGVILLGCVAALLIWLIAEAPLNNMLGICLKPRRQEMSAKGESPIEPSTSADTMASGSGSGGYFQNNLPATVQYSSKI